MSVHWATALGLPPAFQASVLRDVMFTPHRPVVFRATWAGRENDAIRNFARAVCDRREFDRVPELRPMLERAGCDDRTVLAHVGRHGTHFRGCWVIDRLLGKS